MKRKADHLAGEGSLAGKLKKQRESFESGDTSMGRPVVGGDSSLDATGEPVEDNRPSGVLRRGYYIEKDES